jgi:hypothetical protein
VFFGSLHDHYNPATVYRSFSSTLASIADDIKLKLQQNPGNVNRRSPGENFNENFQSTPNTGEKDDLNFTQNETIDCHGARLYLLCGRIKELETGGSDDIVSEATEEEPARQEEDICVLWNHVPEEITLNRTASSISYKFAMAVDTQAGHVRQEMMDGNVNFNMIHSLRSDIWRDLYGAFFASVLLDGAFGPLSGALISARSLIKNSN